MTPCTLQKNMFYRHTDLLDEQWILCDALHGFQQVTAQGHALGCRVGHTFLQHRQKTLYSTKGMGLVSNFSNHTARILATPVHSLLNTLRASSHCSVGWRVHTACVQVWYVPTLTVFVFSPKTPNKDHNEWVTLTLSISFDTVLYEC